MKRRTRMLHTTALESLTLAVEVFNRPSPIARAQGVLLNLQHAFEMLFKAVIWEDRRTIQDKGSGHAYSFKTCLGIVRGLGHIDESEAIVAATIDAQRDTVQHQGADVTEERLYVSAASGLRLFDELLFRVFDERLADHPAFAGRMLPISANPPRELHVLTGNDVDRVRRLLRPGQRRHAEANALLRTLMVSEQAAADPMAHVQQPTEAEVERFARKLQKERDWSTLLPGLARLSLEQDEGLTYNLRIVKHGEAAGVRIVKPDEAGAEDAMLAVKYNELDRYPFYLSASKRGAQNLADQTGLTPTNYARSSTSSASAETTRASRCSRWEARAMRATATRRSRPFGRRVTLVGSRRERRRSGRTTASGRGTRRRSRRHPGSRRAAAIRSRNHREPA